MKKTILMLFSILSMSAFAQKGGDVSEVSKEEIQKQEKLLANSYILKFKQKLTYERVTNFQDAQKMARADIEKKLSELGIKNAKITNIYFGEFTGLAGEFSPEDIAKIKASGLTESIERNGVASINFIEEKGFLPPPPQVIDWGVKRVYQTAGQPFCCPPSSNCKKLAWVIDTGVDQTHPDLINHPSYGVSFVSSEPSANDGNGHGSHVAGVIGAIDNTQGMRGVSAGATIAGVKVLSAGGWGTWADVITGINYVTFMADVARNAGFCTQVANLSLGGFGCSTSISAAVIAMANKGVFVTLASGNSNMPASGFSPACTNGLRIYTVGSIDNNDVYSNFANYGTPPVDCAAPGRNIYSTWMGGGYNTISGTSMAAPHVAGILLVNNGVVRFDSFSTRPADGSKYPIAQVCGSGVISTTSRTSAIDAASLKQSDINKSALKTADN